MPKKSECWNWHRVDREGYGKTGRNTSVHRAAWQAANGPIPEGHIVHHLCHNKGCFRPAHLEAMPAGEHDRMHRKLTHCRRGHPLTPGNGQQYCWTCRAAGQRRRYHAAKEIR